MLFKEGAEVYTSSGDKVGEIERVVMNAANKEVTHLVIREGFLFTTDKLVDISLVGTTSEDRVNLREDAGDLDALPDFKETEFIPIGGRVDERLDKQVDGPPGAYRPLYWFPPVGYTWWGAGGAATHWGYAIPPYVVDTEERVPEGTTALKEGARVLSSDGDHAGDIEAVLTDPDTNRATHLLISQGFLFKETKLIPTTWISVVMEDEVHLLVDSALLKDLPEYKLP